MEFSSDLIRGSIIPIVLKLLDHQEMYGYEMVKVVNERTGGTLQWKEGTLYPALHKLESDGLIRSQWQDGGSGRRRKYYFLTRRGKAELSRRTSEWGQFSLAVNTMLAMG
jgi:PadR family transcriptional regulator PadR